jgi:hypothetical protein
MDRKGRRRKIFFVGFGWFGIVGLKTGPVVQKVEVD